MNALVNSVCYIQNKCGNERVNKFPLSLLHYVCRTDVMEWLTAACLTNERNKQYTNVNAEHPAQGMQAKW